MPLHRAACRGSIRAALIGVILACAAGCAAPGMQREGWLFQVEHGQSLVSEEAGEPKLLRGFSLAGRAHYQAGRWGIGFANEYNLFRVRDVSGKWDALAAGHYGLDLSVLSADGYVRSALSGGLAVLLEGTDIDEPGAIGFYADARPMVIRMKVGRELLLAAAPISALISVPDPRGIPLVDIQFRGVIALEFF